MSGFVCIWHRDDKPLERALLQSWTDFLSYRGPDDREIWIDNSMGMGHALLRTARESQSEQQPASLEGRYRIVADARLDAREGLLVELQRAKRKVFSSTPDCELILHAYAVWGSACVDHLLGDFSFVLWDGARKQLFCARDPFGIKPFYYAQLGEIFLCSNTLNCVRLHPHVTKELNEAAVGDFLLFGMNYDNATTIFRDIRRLPPAHSLTVSSRGLQVRRYWQPPTDGRIRYSKPEEYIENFQSILEKAVADRLRTDRVGILLSGGLDSSSVAAVTTEAAKRSAPATAIRGYTHVYESLIPHNDAEFAREVADFLRIPIQCIALDQTELFERWDDPELDWPEPFSNPLVAGILDSYRIISSECRVVLSGEGGDDFMNLRMWPYLRDLRRRGEWRQLLSETFNYLWVRPFPWRGIRARVLRFAGKDPYAPVFPEWLAPEFSRRANLTARWKEVWELPESQKTHSTNPKGYASITLPQWTLMFEQEDPGVTRYPVETRYPLLDLRIVDYLLAIPPFPYFFQKMLLREAMAQRLPERVRTRPKTPLQSDPILAQLRQTGLERLNGIPWSPDTDRYVNRSALVQPHGKMNPEQVSTNLRPCCLNIWLQSLRRIRYNIQVEARNG